MSVVHYEVNDHVAVVTLNRPDSRNSLDPELIVELAEICDQIKEDGQVRVAVLTGAGESTFCSGFDLGTTIPVITSARDPENEFEEAIATDRELLRRATLAGYDIGKPLVAAVNGHAIAGGMELLLSCDLRVMAQGVKLGLSEVALGLIPGMGGTALLRRHVSSALAMEMLLCAQPIISDELADSGLFNRLVPTDQVLPQALEIAHTVASNAPLAVQAARRVIRQSVDLDEDDALLLESDSGAVLAESDDAKEGPLAFMEKRTPKFQGR